MDKRTIIYESPLVELLMQILWCTCLACLVLKCRFCKSHLLCCCKLVSITCAARSLHVFTQACMVVKHMRYASSYDISDIYTSNNAPMWPWFEYRHALLLVVSWSLSWLLIMIWHWHDQSCMQCWFLLWPDKLALIPLPTDGFAYEFDSKVVWIAAGQAGCRHFSRATGSKERLRRHICV